jgi:hypothetical protein
MGLAMTEARTFKLSFFVWTTPEDLFRKLKRISDDEDWRFLEMARAYRDAAIKSARAPIEFGRPLWDEAQVNSPDFCKANLLRMHWDRSFSIENAIPQHQRWSVYFRRADILRQWPALKPSGRGGRPLKMPQLAQKMLKAYDRENNLDVLTIEELAERFGGSKETCRRARIAAKAERVKKGAVIGHR